MECIRATAAALDDLAPLLDGYRVFYQQESDPEAARRFLNDRFRKQDSVIWMVREAGRALGFVQLYPAFSTVSLQPLYILNDLFVIPDARGRGAGELLLATAQRYCKESGGKGLALETAVDNPAQRLYERLGWKKDTGCFHYFWTATS